MKSNTFVALILISLSGLAVANSDWNSTTATSKKINWQINDWPEKDACERACSSALNKTVKQAQQLCSEAGYTEVAETLEGPCQNTPGNFTCTGRVTLEFTCK